jgi:TPR repeat protein
VEIVARSLLALLLGLLALACATQALAKAEPAPEPTDAEAQFELGMRLAWGLDGTEKDQRAALKWFHKAAAQGHPRAQTQLGMAYKEGRGIDRDMNESIKWMRKGAEQRNAKAQFELGVAYRDGKGVPQDRVLALMWLLLSQQKGGIVARIVVPGLARQLQPRDHKEAWELVYQWRETHGLPRTPAPGEAWKAKFRAGSGSGSERPADSETAPTPQGGATPAEALPQEGDAPPTG